MIDMTAKKMADIFFGKFSELIVPQSKTGELDSNSETQNLIKKNSEKYFKKKLIYLFTLIFLAITAYYFLA